MTVAAIVPAAGRGLRLGGGVPKALRLLDGVPLLVHAVRGLCASGAVDLIVVATLAERLSEVRRLLDPSALVVVGGETRQESVAAALAALPAEVDVVLVHDAARPLTPPAVVAAVAGAVHAGAQAVIPVLPVVDTIKQLDRDGRVVATVPREHLRAVQTPQGFGRSVLVRAHRDADPALPATDDAALVEAIGVPVATVEGSPAAFKITHPLDFAVAEAVLRGAAAVGQP